MQRNATTCMPRPRCCLTAGCASCSPKWQVCIRQTRWSRSRAAYALRFPSPQNLTQPIFNIRHRAELDLRPFRKLLSVLGMLRCAPHDLPALLRRMPRRLESLCLTAENLPEPRDFDAGEC